MKLNRKQLRKIILKEMSAMDGQGSLEPVSVVSEMVVAQLRRFMNLFERHMKEMTRFHRKPYFNDPKRAAMKRPYEQLRDQMGASVMEPIVIKLCLDAISNGIMRSYKSRKTDELIHMAKKIARDL